MATHRWWAPLGARVALATALALSCAGPRAVSRDDAPPSAAAPAAAVAGAAAQALPTAEPPTPTPVPTPAPVPEPREFAIAGGGRYFAETGFAVRDEPGGPRFWTEFQRLGGVAALGLPVSRPFDAPDGARVQVFRQGWLGGAAGAPAAQRGAGDPPPAPPEARQPEPRPDMDFIGRVNVQPKALRQGTTALIRVWAPTAQRVTVNVDRRDLELARQGDAFVGLVAVQRMAALGPRPVRFTLVDGAGRRVVRSDAADTIQVIDGQYDVEHIQVSPEVAGLLDPVKVNQEEALLNGIYGKWTADRLWAGPFSPPAGAAAVTSDFGTRRSVNGGPVNWAHEGTDFDVQIGDVVRAAAHGRVVFAGPLHVRGDTVVVDHGWGVMTGYFHFSRIDVQAGQEVAQDQPIGLAGATGYVTGPHLHFEVRVQNVNAEPLEWLDQDPHRRRDLAAL